jgi:hypothetical protein
MDRAGLDFAIETGLARGLELSGFADFSSATLYFGKRMNRHIIGSQNDLIYLLRDEGWALIFACRLRNCATL